MLNTPSSADSSEPWPRGHTIEPPPARNSPTHPERNRPCPCKTSFLPSGPEWAVYYVLAHRMKTGQSV